MDRRDVLHYRIVSELGQGGMGQVFRAVDRRLGREVALKMLPAEMAGDSDWQERLLREARAASSLNHPGIVTLHGLETADDRMFLVMELVEGEAFSKLVNQKIPWQRAVELVAKVAEALAAAHKRGILHRDIKSDNLMVTTSGQPKVLDFGLAKLREAATTLSLEPGLNSAATTTRMRAAEMPKSFAHAATVRPGTDPSGLTQAGQILGTPSYMAPECYEGVSTVKSEVFSLGIVLYELLVGKRPFDRENEMAMMSAIMLDEPEPPSKSAPDRQLPPAIDTIIAKALAKKPDDRFPDMTSFAAALRETTREKPKKRWPLYAAGGAAIAGASVAIVLVIVLGGKSDGSIPISVASSRRVTLDPGCEEYPRMHPDGKRIVYDGLIKDDYEILLLDLQTNQRKQLTKTPGWDYASALSPDGKTVAYIHEDTTARTLRVVSIDGGDPRDLGAVVNYPAWTRDGALLVGDIAGRVLRRDLATGKDTELGKLPAGARLYHIVEVPTAGVAMLWWTSSDADATGLGELDHGGKLRVIEEAASDYEGGLAASDWRRGYYATRKGATEGNQLLFRPWGGGKATVVPGGLSPGAGIDVTPDGKHLVFSTCVEREYIARINPEAASADLAPVVISRGTWQDTNPYLVDAHHVMITSNRLGPQYGWMIDLDGKEQPRAVTPAGALGASPSPDAKVVVYAGRSGLAIVDTAGGTPRALTTDPSDATPAFTRDSKYVVFERTIDGVTQVHVVEVAGGIPRALSPGSQPAPSPIDDTVAFITASDAAGARRVMLTDLKGSQPRPLGLEAATWQRPRFSPDGKEFLIVRGYQQVIAAPIDGSSPPRTLWSAGTGSVSTAVWAADGKSVIASLGGYEGDLWLAEGKFP